MILLKLLNLLLWTSACSATRQRRFFLDLGFMEQHSMNQLCRHLKPLNTVLTVENTVNHRLHLPSAALVQKIVIDTNGCYGDRALIERNFTVYYEDASDFVKQERLYSDNLFGQWQADDSRIEIILVPVLYTDHFTLSTFEPVQCSKISIYGCTSAEICPDPTCKNNGVCIGNGQCACPKGFMGTKCESPVSEMTYDDYGFVGSAPKVLLTKDAAFDVSGDVKFTIQTPELHARNARTFYLGNNHHGSSAHFQGYGGSCHYSSSHSGGYSHSGHTTYGHSPSHSQHGCVFSHSSGYSHTTYVNYGHNHNHGSTHYIYTTHGTSHHSHGASLHYSNNQLCMNVHNHHHGHHYQVVAPFHPVPGNSYSVCSTYSPHYGAGIYINGHPAASQIKPTVVTPVPSPVPQQPLCFGSCGAHTSGGLHNYTMSNIGMAGGCVPFLANNWLLGLLGTAMSNLLLHQRIPTTIPTHTTRTHGRFTPAPTHTVTQTTTTPPASATTVPVNVATSKYGPVCYDCMHVNNTGTCTTKTQCNADEVCLVFHERNSYTQRCMKEQECQKGLATTLADCWNCCDTNFCNQHCTPVKNNAASCQDDILCYSMSSNVGAYYNVCADPVYSTSVCRKTCGNCQ